MHISYSDSICVASNSFFSKILNSLPPEVEYREPFDSYSEMYALAEDNEDFFEEFSGGGQFYEIDKTNPNFSKSMADPFTFCPLEDIILASLMSIKDIENRKKFLGSILLVGGGGYLPQLGEETIRRVSKLFEKVELGGEKADQSTDLLLREIAPMHASWLGGTVLPKLDSLRDLWIEKGRYLGEMKEEFIDEEEEEPNLDKKLFTRKEESQ
jgi:actin-related protein